MNELVVKSGGVYNFFAKFKAAFDIESEILFFLFRLQPTAIVHFIWYCGTNELEALMAQYRFPPEIVGKTMW